jgi:hypothetical protein
MWNPLKQRKFAFRSTVTVSQTTNLTNEMVQVNWTGFTPSDNTPYDAGTTDYPVMIVECDSIHVTSRSQCYGANNGGTSGAFGPYGPLNSVYATTSPDGTGEADIQILVADENSLLGCGLRHPCSLVIVPAQGGNEFSSPIDCGDHTQDAGGFALGEFAFGQYYQCSWADRIVIPLHFIEAAANCPIGGSGFTAMGSPMLGRAIQSWIAHLCGSSNPLTIVYNPAITEPEAISDLPLGLGDVALTTRPGPTKIGNRSYAYAPLSISAVSLAYWVDNPNTGLPVTVLKFDPRLVAKLLTLSYDFENEGCSAAKKPPPVIGCDSAVDGNPISLFADPEFRELNPSVLTPGGYGAEFQVPTVESGHSDMTYEVTRWIAGNKAADGFLQGQFDPWGMHVNTDYLGLKYPLDSFIGQDNYPVISHQYSPDFPLSAVAQLQAENWNNGTDWEKDETGNYPRDPIEVAGQRALFAIVDQGDAAAFKFPTAELLNDKGKYVAPTARSMLAAANAMVPVGSNGVTRQVSYGSQPADAYPLTMVIYAMVPTSGTSAKKASAIARFLDYAVGPGQRPGLDAGELPPGYVPLPAKLRAETYAAAAKVLKQQGDDLSASPSPAPSASSSAPSTSGTDGSASPAPSSASPSPSSTPVATPVSSPVATPRIVTISLKNAQTAGMVRYAVPIMLVFGLLATLGGLSSLLIGSAGSGLTARLRKISTLRLTRRTHR